MNLTEKRGRGEREGEDESRRRTGTSLPIMMMCVRGAVEKGERERGEDVAVSMRISAALLFSPSSLSSPLSLYRRRLVLGEEMRCRRRGREEATSRREQIAAATEESCTWNYGNAIGAADRWVMEGGGARVSVGCGGTGLGEFIVVLLGLGVNYLRAGFVRWRQANVRCKEYFCH